jgi:hypothetical protein
LYSRWMFSGTLFFTSASNCGIDFGNIIFLSLREFRYSP